MRAENEVNVTTFIEKTFPLEDFKPSMAVEKMMLESQIKEMTGLKRAGLLDFFKCEEIILTGVRAYSQRYQRFASCTAKLIGATKMKYVGPTIPGIIKNVKNILETLPEKEPERQAAPPSPAETGSPGASINSESSAEEAQILMDASARANAEHTSRSRSPTGSSVPRRVRTGGSGERKQSSKRPRVYAPEGGAELHTPPPNPGKDENGKTPSPKADAASDVPKEKKELFRRVLLNLFDQDRVGSCTVEQIGDACAEDAALVLKGDEMMRILEEMQADNRVFCAEGSVYMM
mmetsp:Transcript_59465/g.189371  ORF Transcript_59465/g.189371 Transcript_59465/m.189371 type:complete len:291 (+) Transcript_59465:219-1091(+)